MQLKMKTVFLVAMICMVGSAHAGFVLESDPTVAPKRTGSDVPVNKSLSPGEVEIIKVPTPAPAPVVAAKALPRWDVRVSDVTLRQTLIRWAKDAGWQVSWEVKFDYPVQLEASFVGTFDTAVDLYMNSLRNSEYPLLACLYDGNRVVRVMHYGEKKGCDK